jgi:hypothetical protein
MPLVVLLLALMLEQQHQQQRQQQQQQRVSASRWRRHRQQQQQSVTPQLVSGALAGRLCLPLQAGQTTPLALGQPHQQQVLLRVEMPGMCQSKEQYSQLLLLLLL